MKKRTNAIEFLKRIGKALQLEDEEWWKDVQPVEERGQRRGNLVDDASGIVVERVNLGVGIKHKFNLHEINVTKSSSLVQIDCICICESTNNGC